MQELAKALVKASKQFKKIDRSQKAYNYMYAPLDIVRESTIEALNNNGLQIVQFPISNENQIGIKTMLLHESGQSIESEFFLTPKDHDPQKIGSLLTYLRRYAWLAVLGVAPENEDDDAQSVSASRVELGSPDYVVKTGKKYKGMMLKTIPESEMRSFLIWVDGQKNVNGPLKEDADNMRSFLEE